MPYISLCVCICAPPIVVSQRPIEHIPAATNKRKSRIVERVIFYAVHVLSNESLLVSLCIPLSLLRNSSVKTFPRHRRIVWSIVFYAPYQETSNCLTVTKILSQAPDGCFIPRQTGRLTVSCNINLTLFSAELLVYTVFSVSPVTYPEPGEYSPLPQRFMLD
jgi:hypothetical protein